MALAAFKRHSEKYESCRCSTITMSAFASKLCVTLKLGRSNLSPQQAVATLVSLIVMQS